MAAVSHSWDRSLGRILRVILIGLSVLALGAVIVLAAAPLPRTSVLPAEVVRWWMLGALVFAALLSILRAAWNLARPGFGTIIVFVLIAMAHAVTLGGPTRTPVGGVLSLIAVGVSLLCAVTVLASLGARQGDVRPGARL